MNTKLFLIGSIFLFSSFCFAGEIHDLVEAGNLTDVKKFVKKYKNDKEKLAELLNSKNESGNTPFNLAMDSNHLQIAKVLLQEGIIDIDAPYAQNGQTALHFYVKIGFEDRVKFLLENGADPNKIDGNGKLPSEIAVRNGHYEIVELIQHYRRLLLAFDVAKSGSFSEMKKWILWYENAWWDKKGLLELVNFKNSDGKLLLHQAILGEDSEKVEYLLKKGADPNKKNKRGEVSLHMAAYAGNPEIAELLYKYKAVSSKNHSGQTPYDIAKTGTGKKYQKIAKLFRSKTPASKCASAVAGI